MAATIIDVAKKCGCSKATVSRAFISPETVSEKTRNRVYEAAKELNYTPNTIARALVRQHTENIAFIIHEKQYPTMINPFYAPILEAITQEAMKRQYSVFISTNQDVKLPNGETYLRKHMDGVIFAGQTDRKSVEEMRRHNIPVVLLNHEMDIENLACVAVEHYQGAVQATSHLYERGHKKIGLLAGRFSDQVKEARYNGYMSVLKKNNLPIDERFIVEIDPTMEEAEKVFAELLKLPDRPTAFFCTNDTIAAGAVKATLRAGLKIPQDMAIIGFDDSIVSQTIEPELSTIRIDAAAMGKIAAEKLFDLIDKKELDEIHVKMPTSLVVRSTT